MGSSKMEYFLQYRQAGYPVLEYTEKPNNAANSKTVLDAARGIPELKGRIYLYVPPTKKMNSILLHTFCPKFIEKAGCKAEDDFLIRRILCFFAKNLKK
jgi:hypothetical protein